jgi:hypothetical protein
MRRSKTLVVLMAVLTVSAAWAEDQKGLPVAPSHHHYWDRTNRSLLLIHGGLEAIDFSITHHNLSRGGRELNPTGKALCESGTAGQLVFFGGRTAGVLGIGYLFHRTGHHKLERAFMIGASVDSAYGVTYSFAHR